MATDGTNLYWVADGALTKVPIAGGRSTPLAILDVGQYDPEGIAVDRTNVYVLMNIPQGALVSVPIDGGLVKTLASTIFPQNTMLASDGTNLYWIESSSAGAVVKWSVAEGRLIPLALATAIWFTEGHRRRERLLDDADDRLLGTHRRRISDGAGLRSERADQSRHRRQERFLDGHRHRRGDEAVMARPLRVPGLRCVVATASSALLLTVRGGGCSSNSPCYGVGHPGVS